MGVGRWVVERCCARVIWGVGWGLRRRGFFRWCIWPFRAGGRLERIGLVVGVVDVVDMFG